MGKIAGKVPKLLDKLFDFPYFRQEFDRLFLSPYGLRKKTSKKKEQSATVPKDVYCYRYCFLETKECMHNEVGTCAEILPKELEMKQTIGKDGVELKYKGNQNQFKLAGYAELNNISDWI